MTGTMEIRLKGLIAELKLERDGCLTGFAHSFEEGQVSGLEIAIDALENALRRWQEDDEFPY